ncbi:uncharacterized protein METZ01_LOCUS429342, partial [marine metagenome]
HRQPLRPDPICVVPKMLAPGRGQSKRQGVHHRNQNPARRGLEKIGGLYGRISPSQQMGDAVPTPRQSDMIALQS